MSEQFFEKPILNSPYAYPSRYWELDADGQPTNRIMETRRPAKFVTPVPKPKKRRQSNSSPQQAQLLMDEGLGLSTEKQQYDLTSVINNIRREVDQWRMIPDRWVSPISARKYTLRSLSYH
jgi:type III restriction enzyme